MKKLLLLIILSLVLAGNVQAVDYVDTGDGLWSTPGNWSTGILPTADDWAKISNADSALQTATIGAGVNALAGKCHLGYSGGGTLIITDGGSLTTLRGAQDGDLLLGKNGGTGTLNLIDGAIEVGQDLEVGSGAPGILNVTAGTIDIARDLVIPDAAGSAAEVTMTGGTITIGDQIEMDLTGDGVLTMTGGAINAEDLHMSSNNSLKLYGGTIDLADDIDMNMDGGTIDITFGTLIVGDPGNNGPRISQYIADGWITGFGLVDNLSVVNDGDTITVTAIDPLQRTPAYGAVVPVGTVNLSWANLEPISLEGYPVPAGVWVDVWFGTDPNSLNLEVDAAGPGTTTADVSAPGLGEYIWRVDTYRYGNPAVLDYENDPNIFVDEGWTMYFIASDDTPPEVVIDTAPTATWINEPTPLQATISDDGKSDVTIVWTSDEDPNAVFDPPTTTYAKGTVTYPLVSTTSVTCDYHAGPFVVTATVSDANPLLETHSANVTVDCADNPCQATRGPAGLDAIHPADLDGDCMHNLADLAIIARDWLRGDYKALDEPVTFTE